ncbi:MAG: 50S ribosomal protein L22 [Candidatus Omnitrophica bacterium]|nr:50S ribosomal protein L22 [Candidatus Omnitrophota bacterium]
MIAKASAKFVRIAPRKVRYVIDLIRKKSVSQAQAILNGSPRRAGGILRKILNQALDAAEKNSKIHAGQLFVSKVTADGGPSMRRFRAASMGRASTIQKRTSHIQLELDLLAKPSGPRPAPPAAKPAAKAAVKKVKVGAK